MNILLQCVVLISIATSGAIARGQDKELKTETVTKEVTTKTEEKDSAGKVISTKTESTKKEASVDDLRTAFKFGIALGFESFKDGYVNEAKTEGTTRIVRITDSQKHRPSLWLETHYIWDGWASRRGFSHSAPGFYIGVRALGPDAGVFDAFSMGLLWSFKRTRLGTPISTGEIAESINIGVGPVWHRTRKLAAGIREGEALPAQYQDIEYSKRDEATWMLMLSVGF
jgi:hypothetical protein